ncbi:MAG: amidohydrolase family protein [Candidatus Andeanibacterium colombiense]|uniref:Amidohydrolase family protein n=1 Tax=Candidatus Andeanibacterium colombiense TaxID=3121345 RepID=A0AAJ5X624_9SPHN|nr:MAG: amidohydrolase family protein [Sphingomonadaceae bacterium]
MPLIDAHCHASPLWFEPVEPLVFQMDRNGVAKGVLTQVLGQFDNSYQEECVARFPGRFASVGAVHAASAGAADEVRRWAERGMAGLRLRPEARSPGSDPLAVWRAAAECGLAISCGGAAGNMLTEDFAALAGTFPNLPIVVEQLGGWTRPDCDREPASWAGILALARFPNVSLKIPTLGQIAPRQIGKPLPNDGDPVLDASRGGILLEALDAFGADRLLWGSDFPVVASREGYANALNWTRALFIGRPQAEIDAIFGGNAERIFFARSA